MDRFKPNRGKWDILKDPFWGLNLRVTLYEFFKSLMGANVPDPYPKLESPSKLSNLARSYKL